MPYIVKHRKMALYVGANDGITTLAEMAERFPTPALAHAAIPQDFAGRFIVESTEPKPSRPEAEEADMFAQAEEGERLKREGMATAELHATQRWTQAAYDAVVFVSGLMPEFTSDDVWAALVQGGHDPLETERNGKALGAVMLRAAREKLITKTGAVRNSTRPSLHASPRTVWRKTTTAEYRSA